MAITEASRLEMHLGLREVLGDSVADIVMEHLPPGGWRDVASKADIHGSTDSLRTEFRTEMASLRAEVESAIASIKADLARLEKRLDRSITLGVGFALALLGLQVQIMLSIARL